MGSFPRWMFSDSEKEKLIQTLTANLPLLRARMDISQEEIAKIIGISRQTYSSFENGKRQMSWQVYLALILFFDVNSETHDLLHHLECFPEVLIDRSVKTEGQERIENSGVDNSDISEMLAKLDEQALRSVKTVLMVEYARCSKIPREAIIKAFGSTEFTSAVPRKDPELEKAIARVKRRDDGK
ncbi:MAG TPA: helix-turn-helix domain-containing protein [Candidatus Lachnoclostridium stercoravium]|uniref:Helix-turn-helix domain-containing protein n=1 Tax=Candidatus Lachnoclostridium stercoravium TaxID=2838633 RepID=A0A9D2KNA5_9FIRM|nr:helix-turn-helix domain-containing protein [Candidatus Lachnoclostridium stercoravium]